MKTTINEIMTGNRNALREDEPADAYLHQRVTSERKARYIRQAKKEGLKLSAWMQLHCDAVCDAADEAEKEKE